jgi:membrane protein YdbS with pleckstrin-like domain
MVRRLVISLVLAALVFVLQLWLGHTTSGIALVSAVIALVIAFFVLWISDASFRRRGQR